MIGGSDWPRAKNGVRTLKLNAKLRATGGGEAAKPAESDTPAAEPRARPGHDARVAQARVSMPARRVAHAAVAVAARRRARGRRVPAARRGRAAPRAGAR